MGEHDRNQFCEWFPECAVGLLVGELFSVFFFFNDVLQIGCTFICTSGFEWNMD